MMNKMLEAIGAVYPLKEKDAGKYGKAKVNGMKFTIKFYEAEGLGNVSVMTGVAMFGLMKMDTMVVNPFDRDMGLFSYDRIYAMGNDTLFLEVYDTRLDKQEDKELLKVANKYAAFPESPVAPNWYDDIKWAASVKKKGRKYMTPQFDIFTKEYFDKYIELCGKAPSCEHDAKVKEASKYTEGLLNNGGPSTDQFVKVYGKEYTGGLFREVLFGTGNP